MKKIIHLVMAARPNVMKVAPLYHALKKESWAEPCIVHTGQHYTDNMSGAFLRDLDLPEPQYSLGVGSGTHATQTGNTMMAYEALCLGHRPDLAVVVGDVNATLACALAAKKLGIPVAHMEAGLRSFDRAMPEEINRLATDSICDYLWTPSPDATAQLEREGISGGVTEVGNIMIDAYCLAEDQIKAAGTREDFRLEAGQYAIATFHRPVNVDIIDHLHHICDILADIARDIKIVLPLHPRTRKQLVLNGLMAPLQKNPAVIVCDALPYVPFMNLVLGARLVMTDSGGIQEETTYLGIPCLTLRTTTERPITISQGTNRLVHFGTLADEARRVLVMPSPKRPVIKGWDGRAASRTVRHIAQILGAAPDQVRKREAA